MPITSEKLYKIYNFCSFFLWNFTIDKNKQMCYTVGICSTEQFPFPARKPHMRNFSSQKWTLICATIFPKYSARRAGRNPRKPYRTLVVYESKTPARVRDWFSLNWAIEYHMGGDLKISYLTTEKFYVIIFKKTFFKEPLLDNRKILCYNI